jgi:pimeloyl-ACP methyl ester carboxylesterase
LGEAWVNFTKGVADDGSEFEGGIRSVLKKYYNHLLGPDPIARAIATQSWFRWEMGVSSFNNSLNVGKGIDMGDVIVWDKARNSWLDRHGEVDNEIVESLRRWPQRAPHLHSISSTAKPKQVFQNNLNYNAGNLSKADAETFVPAQAMLTCHYSVNDAFMMSDFQLLKQRNIDRIRHIPCIAVQGARDFICPPDSALDLKEAWPEMECRIVTEGKHSMYDPRILSELVDATDHMAAIDIN